jgi:hypothetical protein
MSSERRPRENPPPRWRKNEDEIGAEMPANAKPTLLSNRNVQVGHRG